MLEKRPVQDGQQRFGMLLVHGRSREPTPPAKTTTCMPAFGAYVRNTAPKPHATCPSKVLKDGLSVHAFGEQHEHSRVSRKSTSQAARCARAEGVHCTTVDQALAAYDHLGSKVVAVKSQIHAGGRGKGTCTTEHRRPRHGGSVKIAFSKRRRPNLRRQHPRKHSGDHPNR